MDQSEGRCLDELVADEVTPLRDWLRAALAHRRVWIWAVLVLAIITALGLQACWPSLSLLTPLHIDLSAGKILLLFLAAMLCEMVDSSLGMGYGTTLTPLLIVVGCEPLHVVPAVLLSECLTGIAAGLLHHRDGNVDFLRDPQARATTIGLLVLTVLGVLAAVSLAGRVPKFWFSFLIAAIVLAVGVLILATGRRKMQLRPGRLLALGAIAAFNKGMTGGGYGPLVTSSQVISGLSPRQAVAITSLAEGVTCLVGVIAYFLAGHGMDWSLALPLCAGAMLSVPIATLAVRQLPETLMRRCVGLITCILGAMALVKVLV